VVRTNEPWTMPSLAMSGRAIALLCTGVLIGWFAERNRTLVAELRLGAERDHLTGIGNHRFYEAAVDRRLGAGRTFALLLCDMDRLKDLNDGHGHSAGDEALRNLADNLRSLARSGDEIARIGGDEFCLVADLRTSGEADSLAARVEAGLTAGGCPATIGWAIHPEDGRSKSELFRVADERLYARKASRTTFLRALPAVG
jgi:diguanylate cyclase (GGDEF)-like protein